MVRDMTSKVVGGQANLGWKYMFFQLNSTIKVNKVAKIMQSAYLCVISHVDHKKLTIGAVLTKLRTADAFPVVASLQQKKKKFRR